MKNFEVLVKEACELTLIQGIKEGKMSPKFMRTTFLIDTKKRAEKMEEFEVCAVIRDHLKEREQQFKQEVQ